VAGTSLNSSTSVAGSLTGGRHVAPLQIKLAQHFALRCGSVSASAGARALPLAIRSGVTSQHSLCESVDGIRGLLECGQPGGSPLVPVMTTQTPARVQQARRVRNSPREFRIVARFPANASSVASACSRYRESVVYPTNGRAKLPRMNSRPGVGESCSGLR